MSVKVPVHQEQSESPADSIVTKFVIHRAQWLRGEPSDSQLLRIRDRKMCCLGFYGKACGLADAIIEDHGDYSTLEDDITEQMEWLLTDRESWGTDNSPEANDLIRVNDNRPENITQEDREAEIIYLFAKQGIEVEFED